VAGAPVAWHRGSALALPFSAAAFDVVLCQLGLQFIPDRPAALREFRRVLVPGGRLALNVFGPIERNPATCALVGALDRHVRPGASAAKRAEHALADVAELRALVAAAAFKDIEIRTATKMVRFSSAADYVRIQMAATPLATLITGYDAAKANHLMDALTGDVGADLAPYAGGGEGLRFPQEVQVVLARS
jgi:SAM-dependent methyltransferase